jgi:hypothetical protein
MKLNKNGALHLKLEVGFGFGFGNDIKHETAIYGGLEARSGEGEGSR